MRKREDRVASGVEWRASPTGRRRSVGTLPGHDRGDAEHERQDGCRNPRARPHPPPAVNGNNASRISSARCHRSARDLARARPIRAASSPGTSRRKPRKSGGAWCWCMSSTAAALGEENGGRPARHSNRTTRSEEHTSELQSQSNLVCRLLLEKKKRIEISTYGISYEESALLEA